MADMQNVIIPPDLDLLMYEDHGERKMLARLGDRQIGPFASTGSFGPISEEMARIDPEKYGDREAVQYGLILLHVSFLKNHQNRAGMEYPSSLFSGASP